MALNVQDFGAAGDGKKDNTEAFAAAMKAAAETGNGAVFVPRGRYLIKGNLDRAGGRHARRGVPRAVRPEPA